jgi:nitrile hydratase subunit alpha
MTDTETRTAPPHDHDDDHDHPHARPPAAIELRVQAVEDLMREKGLLDLDLVEEIVRHFERDLGPMNGAKVVARAWVDPDYRARLFTDATAAIAELGFGGPEGANMVALENTESVHNVVVCTLCSCYPWPVLGLPPRWYKAAPYRSRVVREPRTVLAEMGFAVPNDVEIRVWDSSAEVRYLVVPRRPTETARLDEARLAALVTRDGMIGVAPV